MVDLPATIESKAGFRGRFGCELDVGLGYRRSKKSKLAGLRNNGFYKCLRYRPFVFCHGSGQVIYRQ